MRAVLTAVIAAIEACAVALAGIVLVAVPALLLWWLVFGLSAEPGAIAAVVAGVWLLAHFVPLGVELGPEAALGLGLPPEAIAFTISLAPLGLTLLTVLLALRAGLRCAGRGGGGSAGVLGGAIGFAVATLAVVLLARPAEVWPVWAAVLVPALCYGIGSLAGYLWGSWRDGAEWWAAAVRGVQRGLQPLGAEAAAALPGRALDVLRLAGAAIAGVLGLGALGFAVSLVAGYVEVVTLSQALQLDPLGAVLLFLLELALLPVALVWSVAWFSGAGFAIGTGTSVSPFETLLGPVPALPVLGAVPQGWGWAALLAPLLVVILGVTIGALAGGTASLSRGGRLRAVLVPIGAAVVVGLVFAGLAVLASGGIGPGRLAEIGPPPWTTGGLLAAELGAGMILGVVARRIDAGRLRERLPGLAGEAGPDGPRPDDLTGPGEPGAPVIPVVPVMPSRVTAAPAEPASEAEAEAEAVRGAQGAEAETVPIDPLPSAERSPADAEGLPASAERPSRAPEETAAGSDAEAILRAYAWDEGALDGSLDGSLGTQGDAIDGALGRALGEPGTGAREEGKRRRWRLPRRSD